jgi:hypothetical protein
VKLPSKSLIGRPLNLIYLLEFDKNLSYINDKWDKNSEKCEKLDNVSNRKSAKKNTKKTN